MHRSVRFVLQPYKSRNPPLAAVTQARRDANSGSYGYKAIVTKQPLNRGCPMPDIAHAPDQIRTSPRKLPARSCGNLSLQRILRTSSLNIILYFSSICNKHIGRILTKSNAAFLCIINKLLPFYLKIAPKTNLRRHFRRLILIFLSRNFCTKCRKTSKCTKDQESKLIPCRLLPQIRDLPRGVCQEICKNPLLATRAR